MEQKKPEYILYYSIYRKFKNRQNDSMAIEIRTVVSFGEVLAGSSDILVKCQPTNSQKKGKKVLVLQHLPISMVSILPPGWISSYPCDVTEHTL